MLLSKGIAIYRHLLIIGGMLLGKLSKMADEKTNNTMYFFLKMRYKNEYTNVPFQFSYNKYAHKHFQVTLHNSSIDGDNSTFVGKWPTCMYDSRSDRKIQIENKI